MGSTYLSFSSKIFHITLKVMLNLYADRQACFSIFSSTIGSRNEFGMTL